MGAELILRWLRKSVASVALALFGMVLSLAVVEAGFRIYHALHPSTELGFFWQPNDQYGWGHPAGRVGLWYDNGGEFRTTIQINSHGLRDVEHAYARPPGVFRILILGDSYMEAVQVDLEQTFSRLLEQKLTATGGPRVEVINASVADFGTDNELLYFLHEGYKYRADLVLLAFVTANDVRNNFAPFNHQAPGTNINKPTFTLRRDGSLEKHPGPPVPPPAPWWRELYVGGYLYLRFGGQLFIPPPNPGVPPPSAPNIPYVPCDLQVYATKYSPEVQEAWRVTEALVRALRQEAAARGAEFAVMIVNGPWAHDDDWWNRMMATFPLGQRTWDRRKPNRLIEAFLQREDISHFDLFDPFEAAKARAPLFFYLDPHWRPTAHRVAAETAARFLVAEGLVTGTHASGAHNEPEK